MAYSLFTLSEVTSRFGLTLHETADVFADVAEVAPRLDFMARLNETLDLALLTSTEKARSEYIIAPILAELWKLCNRRIGLLSGVEFNVDESQGLTGVCDYIITGTPEQMFVTTPVLMLVEAKNEEFKRGFAQCIAEMVAAQQFNRREGVADRPIYGAVTIGELWRFLILDGNAVHIDKRNYFLERLPKILGILLHIVQASMPEEQL